MILPAFAPIADAAFEAGGLAMHRTVYLSNGAAVDGNFRRHEREARVVAKCYARALEWAIDESLRIASAWASLPEIRPLADTAVDVYDHCRDRLRRRERALELARDLESWARHYQYINDHGHVGGAWLLRDVLRRHAGRLRREAAKAVQPHGQDYYRRAGQEWLRAQARRES